MITSMHRANARNISRDGDTRQGTMGICMASKESKHGYKFRHADALEVRDVESTIAPYFPCRISVGLYEYSHLAFGVVGRDPLLGSPEPSETPFRFSNLLLVVSLTRSLFPTMDS